MDGITFRFNNGNTVHTMTDWGMFLHGHPLKPAPEPDLLTVRAPGANKTTNLTQSFYGYIPYKSRKIHFELMTVSLPAEWDGERSMVYDILDGQECDIIFDTDTNYFYHGICNVMQHAPERHRDIISIDAECDPYKYEATSSLEPWIWDDFSFIDGIIRDYEDISVSGTYTLMIPGRRMTVSPTFIVTSLSGDGMNVIFNGTTYHLPDGSNRVPSIILTEGENELTFNGNGIISVDYRGGRL